MPARIAVPKFKSEWDEAQWWDAHPEVVTALFLKAKKEGRIERLPRIVAQRNPSRSVCQSPTSKRPRRLRTNVDCPTKPSSKACFTKRLSGRARCDKTALPALLRLDYEPTNRIAEAANLKPSHKGPAWLLRQTIGTAPAAGPAFATPAIFGLRFVTGFSDGGGLDFRAFQAHPETYRL